MFKKIAVAFALTLGFAAAHATPAEYCQKIAAAASKELPSEQDAVTRLVAVSCAGTVLHADFVVHDLPNGTNVNWAKAAIVVRQSVCNQPDPYLNHGVSSIYSYRDVSGNFLNQLTIDRTDCQPAQ